MNEPDAVGVLIIDTLSSGYICPHCAGHGSIPSSYPLPWLTPEGQGLATYTTRLCCLHCAGRGIIPLAKTTDSTTVQPPPIAVEPFIDAEFHEE